MLQACRDAPHRVQNYNSGSWETWLYREGQGLVSKAFGKPLGYHVLEARPSNVDSRLSRACSPLEAVSLTAAGGSRTPGPQGHRVGRTARAEGSTAAGPGGRAAG